MKSSIAIVALLLVVAAAIEARPHKRSVLVAAPVAVAATVPVVHSQVVHHNPTTVVKTEQVRSGDHASYTYSTEVKTQPQVVHTTHAHAAAVVASPVATAHYAVPAATAAHYAVPAAAHYYPTSYYAHSYYSPYSYVIGK